MAYLLIALILINGSFETPTEIVRLEQEANSDPANWKSSLQLADIFIAQANFTQAYNCLSLADQSYAQGFIDSCEADYFYTWGMYYDEKINIPKAIEYYSRTVECDSTFSQAWRNSAYLYEIFGQYDSMMVCLQKCLVNTDDSAGVYYDLGVAYDYLDSLEQSIICYNYSLEIQTYPAAFLNLGVDWGMLGYRDSAMHYFHWAEESGLESPELFYNMGVISYESEDFEQAMDFFSRTLITDPDYTAANLQLGSLYEQTGDTGMAVEYYKEFVRTAPLIYADDIKKVKEYLESLSLSK